MKARMAFTGMLTGLLVLAGGFSGRAHAIIPISERNALIALYEATNGDNWTNSIQNDRPWKDGADFRAPGTEQEWYGVIMDNFGNHVQALQLGNNNLVGPIPSDIQYLPELTSLGLGGSQIDSLPSELGNLSKLESLHLGYCQLTGAIPTWFENLTSLEYLNLDGNQLNSLPSELGNLPNLKYLYIQNSGLTGPIPPELGDLANLNGLGLSGNELSGSIPPELGNLTNLTQLFLDFNILEGGIPPELGNLTELTRLDLQYNDLTGPIPTELGNLTKMVELYLYGNDLSGNIPASLGNLTDLWQLILDNNNLDGPIPPQLGQLDNLYRLSISNNQLSGPIPLELGNMDELEWLMLDHNQLTSPIPSNLQNLTMLEGLWLMNNLFTGNIPSWLGTMTTIRDLRLDDNQFDGSIPPELGNMTSLYELHLEGNQLTGSIPPELGSLSGLNYLYLRNNRLTGPIPSALGSLTELRGLYLNGNYLSGPVPLGITNLTHLALSDFGYNALYADDDAVLAFLDNKDWNWYRSQTVAPEGVAVAAVTATSVTISYTPIEYDWDEGGYRVFYSTSSGEPYTLFGMTADKEVSEVVVTGLTPGTKYYFVVQTRTDPHTDSTSEFNNPNTVDSEYSEEVSATTPIWADLSVTKGDSPDPVTAGQTLTYTVTVQNSGPSEAENVVLTDDVPSDLQNAEYSLNSGGSWSAWTGALNLGNMGPAASQEVLIRAAVASSKTGAVTNTAGVASNTTDPDPGNNDATEETAVQAKADLLVTKGDSADPVIAGEALTYTITVQNQGPSDAVNVLLTDTLPLQIEDPQYSTNGGQTWDYWAGSLGLGTLNPGSSQQVLIKGTVDASATGILNNTPSVSSDTTDPNQGDNTFSEETKIEAEADLLVTKSDEGFDPTLAGNMLMYTITVQNQGPSDAVGVTLEDTVPSPLQSPQYSTDGGTSWDAWTGSLPLGTLGPGDSRQVLILDRVDPSATGTITNTATVSAVTSDPEPGNNSASQETTLEAKADLAITKEENTDPVLAGHELTYTMTVENNGPSDAVKVTLTDQLPTQLKSAQYSTDNGGSWSDWEGSLVLERLEEAGAQVVLIKAAVSPSSFGAISNTVSISSDTTDSISENNSDTEETTAVIMGDMDGDGDVDLSDALFVLQVMCGLSPSYSPSHVLVDLDGDGEIGWGEVFYILQKIAGER